MYAKPGNAWPFRAPGPSHRLLSYALLLISINVCAEAACTWTDRADTVGLQAAATQVNGVFSLDACKAKCEENANCVAVEWQSPFLCYTYTTLTATATLSGRTYSTKTCTTADTTTTTTANSEIPTTTSEQSNESPGSPANTCTMVDNVNTTALSPASLSVDLSSELSCKELCKAVSQCQAMTFGNSRCDLHTSNDTTTSAAGFVHATKQCPGGGFSDLQTDTKGTSSASFSLEANLGSCKSMCLGVSSCVALSFSGTTCKFYTIKPSIGSRSGSTYYEKSCPQGAQTGSLRIDLGTCGSSASRVGLSPLLVAWTLALITNGV